MEIRLKVKNLVEDLGARWLMELQDKQPLPPRGILIQSLNEANARLQTLLNRYKNTPTLPDLEQGGNDDLDKPEEYIYSLRLSSRKGNGKSLALINLLHSYMINSALTKIFSSINIDLSSKHEAQAAADAQSITTLLHQKLPPI